MRRPKYLSRLLLVIVLAACSSPKTESVSPQGLAELQKMLSASQDLSIVVSAGSTEQQYEQRVTDALLKFGKPEDVCPHAIANFSKLENKTMAAEACQHLTKAMAAYTVAKEYFGPKPDPMFPDILLYTLPEKEYVETRERFPNLEELPVSGTTESGYKFYSRSSMLQALWKVAEQESAAAKELIDKVSQP